MLKALSESDLNYAILGIWKLTLPRKASKLQLYGMVDVNKSIISMLPITFFPPFPSPLPASKHWQLQCEHA